MLLTGAAIEQEKRAGRILIAPFDAARLNPASYSFAVADELHEVVWREAGGALHFDWRPVAFEDGRWRLKPRALYLATTQERIGSDDFVMRLIGRPALGLRGVFVQVSADLGHQGANHRWTLEIVATVETHLAPGQLVGQVSFWETAGAVTGYRGVFGASDAPLRSNLHMGPH